MIRLHLPVPPSVNALYANRTGPGRGRFKTRAYKQWIEYADVEWMTQKRRVGRVTGPYELDIRLPNVRGDIDNRQKAILDFLVSRQITDDDRHCQRISIERDATLNHCEVTITARAA